MRVMREEDSNSFTSYTVDAEGIQTAVAELMTQDTRTPAHPVNTGKRAQPRTLAVCARSALA